MRLHCLFLHMSRMVRQMLRVHTCGERSEQIIAAESAADANSEETKGKILCDIRFTVNEALLVSKFHEVAERQADKCT
jgi:hypothetical protein